MAIGIVSDFRHEIVVTILVSAFIGVISMPFKKVKKAFAMLETVHQELLTQRTNCLTTLQSQGNQQIDLLGKAVDTLQEMRIDNREIITHLRDKL